ncbi:MAG: NADPH-dependent 7-cyano-7-deazaguanine reductase QueF [Gammaproteobacteria bacterium]|nr:NADPH-dependent 7-cyano-7-deazaguanine reductase QueF [Gammaproteobacteria bacterium]
MKEWQLGKNTAYETTYNPKLLTPIPRQLLRDDIGINLPLPFKGIDIWNAWELSWLNSKGMPQVASARFQYSAESTHLIESKSFKLYLNSFNQSQFESKEAVSDVLTNDLSEIVNSPVDITLYSAKEAWPRVEEGTGLCLDTLDVSIDSYQLSPDYLQGAVKFNQMPVTEQLYSHLFKSNCMVTGQPDWASVFISYTGSPIEHELLLKYLISFRDHQAFHEPCVERIFVDLMHYCKPKELSVYCRYTRRGGLDINPFRSTKELEPSNLRIWRQ